VTGLVVSGLRAGYDGDPVLRGVTFAVGEGGAAAIFGRNGSGKSTILRAISGLVPWSGRIEYGGKSLAGLSTEAIAALGIAHVPEGRGTFAALSVEENLRVGASLLNRADEATELTHIYELLPQLAERRRQLAGTLSGGEQQMLAIGRALMSRPRLVLLDEPSLGLAPGMVAYLFGILGSLCRHTRCAFLLVEQNPQSVVGLADEMHFLEGGKIVRSMSPDDPNLAEAMKRYGPASDWFADPN